MIGIPPIFMPGVPQLAAPPVETEGQPGPADIAALRARVASQAQMQQTTQTELSSLAARGINPTQTDWYFRPQTGSNTGDGTSGSPLKTFGEFIRRVGPFVYTGGSGAPANLSLHFLEDQPDASDPITLSGTLHDVPFVLDGGLIEVGFGTFGAVTNVERMTAITTTAFNADNTVPVSYWQPFVGMLVNDTTSGTWFRVDQDLGNRKAQLTRPFEGPVTSDFFLAPNSLGTIAQGDAFVIYRHPKIYMGVENLLPFTSTATAPSLVVQRLHMTSDGEAGLCAHNLLSINFVIFVDCLFDGATIIRSYPEQSACVNCYGMGGIILDGSTWVGGGIAPFCTLINHASIDGDAIVHGSAEIWGPSSIGIAYFDNATYEIPFSSLQPPFEGSLSISNAASVYGLAAFWGPTKLIVHDNGSIFYDGTATSQLLCTGGLSIAGLATGAKITPGTPRIITDDVAITVSNLDDTSNGKNAGMISSMAGRGRIIPIK